MHKIYNLKEMLCNELEQYGSREKIDTASLEIIDKLAHAIKNIDKIIETYEEMEYSEYNESRGNSYGREGSSMRGGSYRGGSSRGYDGMSYRDGYARANARGRYSRNDDMRMELQELMNEAPNEQFRQKLQRIMSDM